MITSTGVNGIMDLNTSTGCKSHQGFHPTRDKSTGCKSDHGFDPQQTQVQGVNGTIYLITCTGCKSDHGFDPTTAKSTGCTSVNGSMSLTPQQTQVHKYRMGPWIGSQVQGVNQTMD